MSASLLGVAVLGATVSLTAGAVPLLAGLAVAQSVQNAADAAALAAADTASGLLAGHPCEAAAEAARMNAARVVTCVVDGAVASVVVSGGEEAGFTITSRARAGPPPPEGQ